MASFKKSRSAIRYAPPLIAMFLGCTALTAPAHAWSLFGGDAKAQDAKSSPVKDSKDAKDTKTVPAENLEDSIRQAQMLRLAGSYPEAIKHLSQLMLVAADDSRVISEYGKTLAAMGRAQEAVNFLTRAQQLEPTDWTVYSALGVAYDQMGNQKDAAAAYDHALTLKPGEPSVLSNYALSRLLAKDPDGARTLAARAESADGASDPMIARNIAMVKDVAPQDASVTPQVARVTPPSTAPRMLQPAPVNSVAMNNNAVIDAAPRVAPEARDNRVVMQAVPVDPLAGPVVHMPAPRKTAHVEPQTSMAAAAAQAASPVPAKPKPDAVKTANSQAENLQAKAEAIAKTLTNKPAAIAAAKTEANTPVATAAPRTLQPAPKSENPAKPAEAPRAAPMPAAKLAEAAKPAPAKPAEAPKTVAKAKDVIPGLRMSANAY
jgi:Flp pilus assembly protein TadD